jgi:hypothetical protein
LQFRYPLLYWSQEITKFALFLKSLHLIPIYRTKWRKENQVRKWNFWNVSDAAESNYFNFFWRICVNEWNLRHTEKGTNWLALLWQKVPGWNSYYQHQLFFISQKPKTVYSILAGFKPETLTKTRAAFYNSFTKFLVVFYKMIVKRRSSDLLLSQSS